MIAFITLFFPAVLSVWLLESLRKAPLDRRRWFYCFTLNTVLINFLCFGVKKWILHTAEATLSSFVADMSPAVSLNYLIMALPFALVIAITQAYTPRFLRLHTEPNEDCTEVSDNA